MSSHASLVDPFHGTDAPGNCLPGPYLPMGLVRLGPDTLPGGFDQQITNGYYSRHPIVGFSHTHVGGTGGGGRYGNVQVVPFTGIPRLHLGAYERDGEHAEVGYYRVDLADTGIRVELTATPRCGVHRYHFPKGRAAHLLLDLAACVQVQSGFFKRPGEGTGASVGGFVEFASDTEIVGRGDYKGGWGHTHPYSVYFYARADHPFTDRRVTAAGMGLHNSTAVDGPGCRAVCSFGEVGMVELRVGISFRSIAHARASVDRECAGHAFETIRSQAVWLWDGWFDRVRVEGGTAEDRSLFYSLFYRLLCMPGDLGVDDEFPLWASGVRHFTDFYCLWDSARNANGLVTLFAPELEADWLNCLLDVAEHTGWLPDAWFCGHAGRAQGGSYADVLFCEAALKGIEGIDYTRALHWMRKNNEVESPDPSTVGRPLAHYRDAGYVPAHVPYSASRHVEFAYQDWCIGRLARHVGDDALADRQFASAGKVWNLWREDARAFWPRHADGSWVGGFDPTSRFTGHFYEQSAHAWSLHVPHDWPGLVARLGGPEGFVRHLDDFFDGGHFRAKETLLHAPWLYTVAGRPDRTSLRLRRALRDFFGPGRQGLTENEDMGCQSAFFMCSVLGLYPLMGQDLYWLTAPCFDYSRVTLGTTGNVLSVEAPGAGDARPYVRTASLDGQPLDRAWIRHAGIAGGATLRFELSDTPTDWGRGNAFPV